MVPLIATVALAILSLTIIHNQANNSKQTHFQSINEKIENVFSSASNLAYKISTDSNIVNYAKSSSRDYYKEYEIRIYLENIIGGYSDIQMCYIYLPQYDYVISNELGLRSRSFYGRYYNFGYGDNIGCHVSRLTSISELNSILFQSVAV
jgi:hypothetical protein